MTPAPETAPADADGYNYRHFDFRHYLEGREREAVVAGGEAADARVQRPDGTPLQLSDLWRDRPLVLETGSVTCPVFVGKIPEMDRLSRTHGDAVRFAVLYVREAHPGEDRPPHGSLAEKRERARELVSAEGLERPVLVDDLRGTASRVYGGKPNSVHVIGTDGVVSYRADWCDPSEVEREVERLLAAGGRGADVGARSRRDNFARPSPELLRAARRVMRRAGSPALRDFLLQVPRILAYRLRRRLGL